MEKVSHLLVREREDLSGLLLQEQRWQLLTRLLSTREGAERMWLNGDMRAIWWSSTGEPLEQGIALAHMVSFMVLRRVVFRDHEH